MNGTYFVSARRAMIGKSCLAAVLVSGVLLLSVPASAQAFQVIHNFTGGTDGAAPPDTLAQDVGGHFYGTTSLGGQNGDGIVFKFVHVNSGWILTPIYNFTAQSGVPGWGVTIAANGTLYTNASYASVLGGACGTVLLLRPPATAPRSVYTMWNETAMWTYVGSQEGCPTGNLTLDAAGNVYGVTQGGGANGWGSTFELTHSASGWSETVLYSFQDGTDGGAPYSGVILDSAGNLYGTATARGANRAGTVFELSPSSGGWTYKVLYSLQGGNDGSQPVAGLIFDSDGNLYGATASDGSGDGGTVFELTPSQGNWNFNLLTSLTGGGGPVASLTMDPVGKLYGTTFRDDSYGYGSVFKLTPSNGSWTYTDLHDFTGGADGGYPGGGVVLDSSGIFYGTAVLGGTNGGGVIYEITP